MYIFIIFAHRNLYHIYMISIQEQLAQNTATALLALYEADVNQSTITIQETPQGFAGDFTIVLFPFLKISRKSPQQTGQEVGEELMKTEPLISGFSMVKGFLNLELKQQFWVSFIMDSANNEQYGFKQATHDQKPVLVEFSSPNTNKPLHLGHIRNNLLGDAVSSLLMAAGEKVVRVNLVNDRGIHICKSMLAWMKFGKGITPDISGDKGDKFVGSFYVAFDKAYKAEIEQLVLSGLTPEEAAQHSTIMTEAREMLRLWEEGDEKIRSLWQQMNEWVYEGFEKTYTRLGIQFEKTYYESDTYLEGKSIVLDGVTKGYLEQQSDSSVWIDLTQQGMDKKLLLRSDGTSVYITQDIGTALIRDKEFAPQKMIYVVGNEQNYHFEVLVKVFEALKYPLAKKIRHLSYGMVELPSGKMKSREGTVVDADDLLDEMFDTAKKTTAELGKWSEDELSELDHLFEILGTGALKYYILKVDPKKQMLFNPKESIDFNGNTGPFIQYTHARIASLARKGAEIGVSGDTTKIRSSYLPDDAELQLIKHLYKWPSLLQNAAAELNPAPVANFAYDTAKLFNQFYQNLSVLNDPDPEKVNFRLVLSRFTGAVLRSSMGILGIQLPEKM